jgi:hypothetical protein
MTEAEARQVLLLRAVEAGAETPLWTADDRAWATRLTRETAAAEADFPRMLVARAQHALQRLLPRDPAARRWLEARAWRPLWGLGAALAAFVFGAVVDHIGGSQRVDLLAPPVWAVIAWNLAVYAGLLLPHRAAAWRGPWVRRLGAGNGPFALLWARHAAPLSLARAALLLHACAAALALGLVAGLYVRGLVLDYRAGWQSTFLGAPLVQSLLATLLAPATAVTGIAVPDVAPLRLLPGGAATASAAPWIHLYATMLLLFVVLPRGVLAAGAAWRARALSARFPLSLADPYFERLRLQLQGGSALVQVLPYAADCGPQAALGLRAVLATALGDGVQLRVAPATAFGDEEAAAAIQPVPGASLRVLLFDLAATPEAESQGRFIAALAGGAPRLLVADEAAFQRRFAALPRRLAERRAAWQRLADEHDVALLSVNLDAPDLAAATGTLQRVLAR